MFRFLLWTTQSRFPQPQFPGFLLILPFYNKKSWYFYIRHLQYLIKFVCCRYVGMSVYNVTIMCVLGVAISAVLNEHPNASFVLISVFIIFCTTGTLCLVFVPKVAPTSSSPFLTPNRPLSFALSCHTFWRRSQIFMYWLGRCVRMLKEIIENSPTRIMVEIWIIPILVDKSCCYSW